ncbi:MAG: hypothetical protein HS114_22790 [Anaerolineales bacterium]|nr:hypothetical protein [Anaerolineales bacterium]
MEPLTPTHHLVSAVKTKATLETAVGLLKELGQADITAFADDLNRSYPNCWLALVAGATTGSRA